MPISSQSKSSRLLTLILCFAISSTSLAQVLTREDSLNANLIATDRTTVISGYGEARVQRNNRYQTATADLTRNVLFVGHKFSNTISFFSEMELEHGFVAAGEEGQGSQAELSMEQLFLKFNITPNHYFTAGLFIPRMGIINENHLPTTFNGNDRPFVEQLVLPSTWREIGIGFYGISNKIAGLNYSFSIVNGLNSANFAMGTGIRDGRGLGNQANASNIAVHAAALKYSGNWRIQGSYYFGGSAGLTKREADSLQLSYGSFGTPVQLGEVNVQYLNKGLTFKTLATWINVIDAQQINRAYASNTPEQMAGAYAEVGYNILSKNAKYTDKNLTLFARYEWMDMDMKVASNGIENDELNKQFLIAGISYHPVRGVVIKADFVQAITGQRNDALVVTPFPNALPFYTHNSFMNLGVGYSF
jgi:hypothetical protein